MPKPTRCVIHDKVLVCPSCIAAERGRKGGKNRVRNAKNNAIIEAAGRLGGRKPKDMNDLTPPRSVMTPLNES